MAQLHTHEDMRLFGIAVPIVEFRDLARAQVVAQGAKTAGAFGNRGANQRLPLFTQRGQFGDMAQPVKVHVGAAENGDKAPVLQVLPLDILFQPGQGQCPGRFRDGAGILEYILDRGADLVDVDRQDLIDQLPADAECFLSRLPYRGAVGEDVHVIQGDPLTGFHRPVHAGCPVMLHTDDFYLRAGRFHVQGDPGYQSAAADRDEDTVRLLIALLQQFHAHGSLSGDDQRVVVGRDEGPALPGGQFFRMQPGLVIGIAVQDHPGVETPYCAHLDLRRGLRHHDGRADIHFAGRQGDTLGVVSGRSGDDAVAFLLVAQRGNQVIGAAQFIGKHRLLIFPLQPDMVVQRPGSLSGVIQGGAPGDVVNPGRCRAD